MPIFDNVMRYIYHFFILVLSLFCLDSCSVMMDNESAEDYEKSTLVRVGDMAPDFTVELLSGNKATLSQMQGNTVLLVFFESTCPDCKLQLSLLNGVLEQFADKNFALLTISRGENKQTLTTIADNYGYRFDIGLDTDKSIYSLYATKYVPRCFVIDPLGHIIATSVGYSANDFALLLDVIINNLQN